MPGTRSPTSTNRLLDGLPGRDRRRMLACCDEVELSSEHVLHTAGDPLRHVYFPIDALISLVTPLEHSFGLEVALVGDEGMVGVSSLLGVSESPLRHLVQASGRALRIDALSLQRELDRGPAVRRRLNRYLYVKMHQMAQAAACARFHRVEERLARWLLTTHDRAHSDDFRATHVFLAHMLGARRVGITKAATSLQRRSVIHYSRGHIWILDRSALEAGSCGCYVAAKTLYERALG